MPAGEEVVNQIDRGLHQWGLSRDTLSPDDRMKFCIEEFKARADRSNRNLDGAIMLASQTLKSLEWINGAAAAGLLTFFGNALVRGSAVPISPPLVAVSLVFFGLGLFAAVVGCGVAYGSQLRVATDKIWAAQPPEGEIENRTRALWIAGTSAVLFVFGLFAAILSFSLTTAGPPQIAPIAPHTPAPAANVTVVPTPPR